MDRTKTDTIIGIVGAVAIVFTLVGVFAYEYNNAPDSTDGDDDTSTEPVASSETFDGSVDADGSDVVSLTAPSSVLTMEVTIDWTPTAPGAVEAATGYSYELRDPDGTVVDSGSSTTGVTITVDDPMAGGYELTISAPNPSQGGTFSGSADYTASAE